MLLLAKQFFRFFYSFNCYFQNCWIKTLWIVIIFILNIFLQMKPQMLPQDINPLAMLVRKSLQYSQKGIRIRRSICAKTRNRNSLISFVIFNVHFQLSSISLKDLLKFESASSNPPTLIPKIMGLIKLVLIQYK